MELMSKIKERIEKLRSMYGKDICTDPVINGDIIEYTFMPDDVTGYVVEIDTTTNMIRHKGLSKGCFWTEWVEL